MIRNAASAAARRAAAGVRPPPVDRLIRVGLPTDARMLATLIEAAGRGNAMRPSYAAWFPGSSADRVRQLECLVRAPVRTWCHWSVFWVAEVGGCVAAALACYESSLSTREALDRALDGGWGSDLPTALRQREVLRDSGCLPSQDGVWTIDHAATLPSLRRRGLAAELLVEALREGRTVGYSSAATDIASDNIAALRLFEAAGFVEQCRCACGKAGGPGGCRGMTRLGRNLEMATRRLGRGRGALRQRRPSRGR